MWPDRRTLLLLGASSVLVVSCVGAGLYLRPAPEGVAEPCGCEVPEVAGPAPAREGPTAPEPALEILPEPPSIPDVALVNQRGEPVRFRTDLIEGKVVAIQFIFTTCKGICPPMGATFASLRRSMPGVQFISVSVDPETDGPDRLDAWSRGLGAGPNWTQVTGPRPAVVRLLKALHAYNADKNEHTPLVLAGDDRAGRWSRVHGLATPERLARVLEGLRGPGVVDRAPDPGAGAAGGPPEAADPASPGLRHFTDTPVVDQHGTTLRMFSDLLRDRVVVVNFFFTSCKGSCPVLMTKLRQIERHFRGRGGSGLVLVSISVDPARDGVPELATRAGELGVGPGWHLVTAKPEDMKLILSRFGQELGAPEQHTNVLMVGNERTKLWKKLNGLSPVEQLIPLVEEVMDDRGDTTPDVPAR